MFFPKSFLIGLSMAASMIVIGQDGTGGIDKIAEFEKRAHHRALKSGSSAQDDGVDVFHVDANWRLSPSNRFLTGTIHHTLRLNSPMAEISFDLEKSMAVSTVLVNDQPSTKRVAGNVVFVANTAGNFLANQNYKITIVYSGSPVSNGFGSYMTATHEGAPITWTLSEPFGAKDWWPCRQNLFDKIDSLDVHLDIPDGNRGGSNGTLVSVTSGDLGRKIYHWRSHYPIATYLVAMAVTNYDEVLDSIEFASGKLQLQHYIYPENNNSSVLNELRNTRRFLQIFDSLFIPYPFMQDKYGHAQFGWGGGMEHQTMSFMGNFQYDLVAHELGHQWFGDHVTCGRWDDIWLNEGFATYLTALVHNVESPNQYWKIWKNNVRNTIIREAGGSVFINDAEDSTVNRIFDSRLTYYKGAFVLHMLRWTMGDNAFFQGIRNYLNDPFLRSNFAQTDDLKRHLEISSGMDLDRFFEQWVYRQGHPTYTVEWNTVQPITAIKLTQSQSHPSVDFFVLDLPVRILNSEHDTIVRLKNNYNGEAYHLNLGFTPDSIIVDPDLWIAMAPATVVKNKDLQINLPLLFPNPATKTLYITNSGINNTDQLRLINAIGQPIVPKIAVVEGEMIQLDISDLAGGTYVLRNAEKVLGQFVKIP